MVEWISEIGKRETAETMFDIAGFKKRKRLIAYLFLYVSLLAIFGFLLYKFMLSPELNRFTRLRSQSAQQQNILNTKMQKMQDRDKLSKNLQNLQVEAGQMGILLFNRDEALDFQRLLPAMVSQTGNVLVSMTPLEEKQLATSPAKGKSAKGKSAKSVSECCSQMPVKMSIRGKYSQVVKLFERLENSEKLMTVSELDLTASADSGSEVKADFVLNLIQTDRELYRPPSEVLLSVTEDKGTVYANQSESISAMYNPDRSGSKKLASTGEIVTIRIDNYTTGVSKLQIGKPSNLSFAFTNISNIKWNFGAAATLRKPNGVTIDLPVKPVMLEPNEQAKVQWDYTIDMPGYWKLIFGVWEEPIPPVKNPIAHSGWLTGLIKK